METSQLCQQIESRLALLEEVLAQVYHEIEKGLLWEEEMVIPGLSFEWEERIMRINLLMECAELGKPINERIGLYLVAAKEESERIIAEAQREERQLIQMNQLVAEVPVTTLEETKKTGLKGELPIQSAGEALRQVEYKRQQALSKLCQSYEVTKREC